VGAESIADIMCLPPLLQDFLDVAADSTRSHLVMAVVLLLSACTTTDPHQDHQNLVTAVQVPDPGQRHRKSNAVGVIPTPPPKPEIKYDLPISNSIWEQLRSYFGLPMPEAKYLRPYLKDYGSKSWAVETLLERSEPYLAWITKQTKRQGIPAEIALLPAVESAFDPLAESPGDAAGLWQFIPATGRRFGLMENWWYDGRKDVVTSTHAALKYLKYLHQRFDGDWLLALAAYNTGEGKIRAAIKSNQRTGKPVDYWHLKLPKETTDYVPRLLALRLVVEHPGRYGITLPDIQQQPVMAIVDTDGQIELSIAAQLADVSPDTLYRLNPGYKRGATPPRGPHQIVLPADRVGRFQTQLAELPPEQRVQWRRHEIKSGETLSHIALQYKTTVPALRTVNGLKSDRIRSGAHLVIPGSLHPKQAQVLAANTGQTRWWQNITKRTKKMVHGVRPGDTLWDLARHYGVSVQQLASWNHISTTDYLQPGQKLVLHTR